MTAFEIYSAVGGVGEDILEESETIPKKKITKIIPLMAAAACFAVFAAGISLALRNDDIQQPVTDSSSITEERDRPETVPDTEKFTDPNTVTETSSSVTEEDVETENEMPNPFYIEEGTGGDQYDGFYLPCNYILDSIPSALIRLRDSDEAAKWLEKDKLSSRSEIPSSINDYVNLYSFIIEFNITREEAETALEYYLQSRVGLYAVA